MQLAQLISTMRKEGYHATRGRIRCAFRGGYAQPLPEKVARGANNYTSRHMKQLRRYFIFIRPGPRPDRPGEFTICGQSDRVWRLERKQKNRLEQKAAEEQKTAFWASIDRLESLIL